MWRARNVLLGSVLGAGICFPLGNLRVLCAFFFVSLVGPSFYNYLK